jgi:hypothetical protein
MYLNESWFVWNLKIKTLKEEKIEINELTKKTKTSLWLEMKNDALKEHNLPFLDHVLYDSYSFSNRNLTKKHKMSKIESIILNLYLWWLFANILILELLNRVIPNNVTFDSN